MKRWMAMMLSGCLLLQSWMGSSIQADGAERITAEQQVAEKTVTETTVPERTKSEKAAAEKSEGALVVEVKPGLMFPRELTRFVYRPNALRTADKRCRLKRDGFQKSRYVRPGSLHREV